MILSLTPWFYTLILTRGKMSATVVFPGGQVSGEADVGGGQMSGHTRYVVNSRAAPRRELDWMVSITKLFPGGRTGGQLALPWWRCAIRGSRSCRRRAIAAAAIATTGMRPTKIESSWIWSAERRAQRGLAGEKIPKLLWRWLAVKREQCKIHLYSAQSQ